MTALTIAVNFDGSKIYAVILSKIYIYEKNSEVYTNVYTINDGNSYLYMEITQNDEMVILGSSSGKIVIYNQNDSVVQSISSSSSGLTVASASSDYSLIAGGGFSQ